MKHSILVIDTGTSSMRGILYSPDGQSFWKHQIPYAMTVTGGIAAEQDTADFKNALLQICKHAAEASMDQSFAIDGLSLTSQRSSVIALSADGEPLAPAMMWYDKRPDSICADVNGNQGDELYRLCGMHASSVLSAPKIAWMKRNIPGLYDRAYKFIGIHDYLLYLLTGDFFTDSSLASRSCMMDIQKQQWSLELLKMFDISPDKLARLVPPGTVVGEVSPEFEALTGLKAGTPVVTGGGDQQCSVLGQGLFETGQIGITTGTGAYLCAVTDKPVFDPAKKTTLTAAAIPGRWVVEASTLSSGSVFNWFNNTFYAESGDSFPFETLDREIEETPLGAHGVVMLPDLAGRGCPSWDSHARGVFYNLMLETTRKDCARAALEGIAAEIAECYRILHELIPQAVAVKSTGGLSKFGCFNQMVSDMIDFPVEKCKAEEATALGAWVNAACALKIVTSPQEALAPLSAGSQCFQPDSGRHARYQKIREVRRLLYDSLPTEKLAALVGEAEK